jgi:hypothetical protein
VEQRGVRLEPTAATRHSTTQATLPSADHAAEIARLQREREDPASFVIAATSSRRASSPMLKGSALFSQRACVGLAILF